MLSEAKGKVDFHLHSYASNVTDYYAANSFSIPESYSDPFVLERALRQQGMTLLTITDHNSIAGVRELLDAHVEDVFISSELTVTFPEDGCNIHLTVVNVTEAQFAELDRLRGNVYDVIALLDAEIARAAGRKDVNAITYFMTHPLMSTQNRPYGREGALSLAHLEKMLLLCNTFEVRNGTRTRSLNELTEQMICGLDRQTIERLANEHGIAPKGDAPWLKTIVGGSDDHSGINPGRTWTEFPLPPGGRATPNDLVEAMRARRTRPAGAHGGPVTLAHAMLKLLHDGQSPARAKGGARSLRLGGPVRSLLRLVFDTDSLRPHERVALEFRTWLGARFDGLVRSRHDSRQRRFESVLASEVHELVRTGELRQLLASAADTDGRIFQVVSTLVNRMFGRYVKRIERSARRDPIRLVKEVVALASSNLLFSMPYLLSYFHQSSDRKIVADVRKAFAIESGQSLVLVTDTFFEINGVARTIWRMVHEAERRGLPLTVVTCLGAAEYERQTARPEVQRLIASGRLKIFRSIVNLDFPQYDGLEIHFPPFLELLEYLQRSGFTRMQVSTPGTIGVAGLMAAKVLQIETSATYHTSFPEYVENYTRDISLEALTWRYMILFYHSVDEVVVPSRFIARLLHERGLRKRKLLILDRWVDLERFHPRHRTAGYWARHGIANEAELVKFVYVGRLGAEKNLALLADAYRAVHARDPRAHLIVIGDGPYRAELERRLAGLPATLVGFIEGPELPRAIASCDAKLFPSTTDTWGNAPLEAQASGLPVVVSDSGGPQELMVDETTGIRVIGRSVHGLIEAMTRLLDRDVRERLGREARAFVERNHVEEPFTAILDPETFRRRVRRSKGAAHSAAETTEVPVPEVLELRFEEDALALRSAD
jgi:glycosyltransferase involved in cell wall biosynthesis